MAEEEPPLVRIERRTPRDNRGRARYSHTILHGQPRVAELRCLLGNSHYNIILTHTVDKCATPFCQVEFYRVLKTMLSPLF